MKTSVIPAQITTIEDKIAGNLNLTQIVLLLLALFASVVIFAIFPQRLHFTYYKIPLMIITSAVFLLLALRIKGKVVLEWLLVLVTYNLRPKFYLYNKNSAYLRDILPLEKQPTNVALAAKSQVKIVKEKAKIIKLADVIRMEQLLSNPSNHFSFKFGKKGGYNGAISKVQK